MRWKSHVRCGVGENLEITSKGYLSLLNETGGMINILGEFGFFSNVNELEKIISDEQVDYVSTNIANELYEILVELN